MGSNAINSIAVGLCLMMVAVYFSNDSVRIFQNILDTTGLSELRFVKNVLKRFTENVDVKETSATNEASKLPKKDQLLLSSEELKMFDGGAESKGLYLAILGDVFDVEKGAQHYRPGGGYAFFAGKDATRAYITGDFSASGLIDDVSDLDAASLASLQDWLSFYKEEYKLVGKVIGRYYDANGKPTKELISVKEKMNHAQKNKYVDEQAKEIFPPCNSEWSKEKGSKVWCSKKSGGVDRAWVGVPRELHGDGRDPRCVCVKNYGPPASAPDSQDHKDRGDLDHPDLKEYPGCKPSSVSCEVSHP